MIFTYYEYQQAEALAGDEFWALCNRLGAEGWRLMDRSTYTTRGGADYAVGTFERVVLEQAVT